MLTEATPHLCAGNVVTLEREPPDPQVDRARGERAEPSLLALAGKNRL
jgi:hypothetical protein